MLCDINKANVESFFLMFTSAHVEGLNYPIKKIKIRQKGKHKYLYIV